MSFSFVLLSHFSLKSWLPIFLYKLFNYKICYMMNEIKILLCILFTILPKFSSFLKYLKNWICHPPSVFFPLFKVSLQFLTLGIFTLKPLCLWCFPLSLCSLFSIPFSWVIALIAVPRASLWACMRVNTLLKGKEKRKKWGR